MKIEPPRGPGAPSAARRPNGADAAGFSLPSEGVRPAAAAGAAHAVTSVNGLFALQIDGAGRRQKQLRRGAAALDTLDRLQAALLDGADADVSELAGHLADREPTGDPGLDSVLREIDVRAAVEIAKRQRAGAGRA